MVVVLMASLVVTASVMVVVEVVVGTGDCSSDCVCGGLHFPASKTKVLYQFMCVMQRNGIGS